MQLNPNMHVAELALLELLRVNRVYLAISEAKRVWPESTVLRAQEVEQALLRKPINWVALREACIAANMDRTYTLEHFSPVAYAAQQGIIEPRRWSLRETMDHVERKGVMATQVVTQHRDAAQAQRVHTVEEIRYIVASLIQKEQLQEVEQ